MGCLDIPAALPQSKTYYSQTPLAAKSKAGWDEGAVVMEGGGGRVVVVGGECCFDSTIFQHITV